MAAEILTRAGVKCLRLIDRDVVEWTNLQRQALFEERDAIDAASKAQAAAEHLARINRDVELVPVVTDVSAANVGAAIADVDLVIDAADNFALRFLLNDWSLANEIPWVHGGCVGATGQVRLFDGKGTPCFRCVVPEPPPASAVDTCDTAGVVGSATHTIASLQATEAIKWLSGARDAVRDTMLSIDLWNNRIREISISRSIGATCTACGERRLEFLDGSRGNAGPAVTLCGRDAVQIQAESESDVNLNKVADRWEGIGRVQSTRFFVRLHVDPFTVTLFRDGRTVVSGTDDLAKARSIASQYVGQ